MPLPIRKPQIKHAIQVLDAQRTDVGRDDDVLRVPQRIVLGQGLGVGDVEGGAGQRVVVQRGDQRGLVDNRAARDVDDERALGALLAETRLCGAWRRRGQEAKLLGAEQVPRRGRQGERDEQRVEPRAQERVQRFLARPAVPCRRDAAVRVAGPGHPVAGVLARLGRRAWTRRVGVDGGAEG